MKAKFIQSELRVLALSASTLTTHACNLPCSAIAGSLNHTLFLHSSTVTYALYTSCPFLICCHAFTLFLTHTHALSYSHSLNLLVLSYRHSFPLILWHAFILSYSLIHHPRLTTPKYQLPFHSMYGATAPSRPWPPSKLASTRLCFQLFSSILLLPAAVMHPSEPRLPIWFLVFPLVLCCGRFHLKPFLGSSLPPFLLYGPPTLVFWFLYLPLCLDRYIGCIVHYFI